ncbi:UDP-N-acetylmuramoyl-L-alanine--D-glutamate ligase [Candidatus Uhrbacteria bacterium]|nr:UDP-N-acetylmuramoyl-L-alanine--D-glutamate ligase [Candidatus Uhrbacteria bacterium]
MDIKGLKGKRVIILGFGKEGQATFAALGTRGITATVTDEAELTLDIPEYAPLNALTADADTVVIKSPGIPPHRPGVQKFLAEGATITSATNIFFAERKGRGLLIGITGTKGKSTTASLLAHVLTAAGTSARLVGNIGSPALAELDAPDDTVFVVELSSYQLSDLTTPPDIGVILNLYEEHMDWHGSVAAYQSAKLRLGEIMSERDVLVYNDAFPRLADLAARTKATALPFAADDAVLDALTVKGEHNRTNARGVLAVCDHLGIDRGIVRDAFASFVPLPHRLQEVGEVRGVTFVNDSISTTPQSALAAIDVYEKRLGAIILGGQDRGYDFSALAKRLKQLPHVLALVMPGGDRLFAALEDVGVQAERVGDLDEAVKKSLEHMPSGGVCLMSPASPSYGQFKNFEQRGEMFADAVAGLKL